MNARSITIAAGMLFAAALSYRTGLDARQSTVPQPPGAPAGAQGAGRAGGLGRGAGAMLFAQNCAGCHGADLNGDRAPSLFDETWTIPNTDNAIVKAIHDGLPGTGMQGFAGALDDQQIWQIVQFIRTQAGVLKGRPSYVPEPAGVVVTSEKQTFKIDVVARNLETPWGLAFLPDGRLLVSERPGRLRIIDKHGQMSAPVVGTPNVYEVQDGGMFDVEVHPQYAKNGWVYLAYSEAQPGYVAPPVPANTSSAVAPARGRGNQRMPSMTRIVRGRVSRDNRWVDQQDIFRGPVEMFTLSDIHYGARFLFDRQGHLFYTLGDRGAMENAQNLMSPLGKIHRVNDDGSPAKGNPFEGRSDALATIWSYGHRNPQGLAINPVTGDLWETEHGPTGGDEVNVIRPGLNYGWGVITMGIQAGITKRTQEGMEQPIVYYTPTLAPSGITFYRGNKYPRWKNTSLFIGCLGGQQLRRLETQGRTVTAQETLFGQFGRVHDVIEGPDGWLYATLQLPGPSTITSTPGMVVRLLPVK